MELKKKIKKKASTKKVVKKVASSKKKTESVKKTNKIVTKKTQTAFEKPQTLSEKSAVIKTFALRQGDTGSPEVQVALLSQKIINLTKHLNDNPKDNHSRRGLLKIVAKRRRILNYLQKKDEKRYKDLIKRLNLKK